MIPIRPVIAGLVIGLGFHAAAQDKKRPREFTIAPTKLEAPPDFVTTVPVPGASVAAVSDAAGLLVVGRQNPDPKARDDRHLAVFRLGPDGLPAADPAWITLPKPPALADESNYAVGLLFHPSLPVLYVWQDVTAPPPEKQEKDPAFTKWLDFDHLVIFSVKDGTLQPIASGASGAGFHCGLSGGTIGLDYEGKTLFVPNVTGESPTSGAIAFYSLDANGLPGEQPGFEQEPGKAAQRMSLSKKAEDKENRDMTVPRDQKLYRYFPTGQGWFAGREAVIMGGYNGCMVGDFHNGSLRQAWFTLPLLQGHCTLAGHPTAPAVYLAMHDHNHLYAIAQIDGYLTQLPQDATLTGAHFIGLPVVMGKRAKIAIGDNLLKAVHLFGLRPDGMLDGTGEQFSVKVTGPVRGLAYSEKFDRLYVAGDGG